jgi:spermidine/putrescine transport system permease protein
MRIYAQARAAPTPALNALATLMLAASLLALALAYTMLRAMTRGERRTGSQSALGQLATLDTGGR